MITNQFDSLLPSKGKSVMGLIPVPEWCSINLDDAVLHQSLGPDELIVAGIVDDIQDPCLSRDG